MSRYVNTSFPPITDAGRALLAAATAAAERQAIGLSDLSDGELAGLAHANTVCGFTYPSELWTGDFVAKIGTLGSKWTALLGGSGAVSIAQTGTRGGGNTLTTGATAASYVQLISCINGLAAYGSALMDDLIAATSKWHVESVFKFTSTPDAVTEGGIGWIAPDGTPEPVFGVRGHQSTTKFRCYVPGTATGVDSTVSIDTNPHRGRMWANGNGTIYFSIDGETAIPLTGYVTSKPAAAYVTLSNNATAAAQTMILSQTRYRTHGLIA